MNLIFLLTLKIKKFKITVGGSHSAFLTEDKNSTIESQYLVKLVPIMKLLVINHITTINLIKFRFCCGYSFTAVIDDSQLYSWNSGENGRLGNGDSKSVILQKR